MTEEVIETLPENALQAPPPEIAEIEENAPVEAVVEETPEPEPAPSEDKRKNPWFLKRISDEAARAQAAEQKASDLQAMLERLQAGKEAPTATPPTNAPDFQTAVQQEAARLLFEQDRQTLVAAGQREFGAENFNGIAAVLGAAGAATADFIQDVMAVDKTNAHKILATLAEDPERASALAAMDPRRRTAELTRISMTTTTPPTVTAKAPAAKQVSKAPAPPPPVEPSATKVVDWRTDAASDSDFDAGFKEMMLKRNQRR